MQRLSEVGATQGSESTSKVLALPELAGGAEAGNSAWEEGYRAVDWNWSGHSHAVVNCVTEYSVEPVVNRLGQCRWDQAYAGDSLGRVWECGVHAARPQRQCVGLERNWLES